MWPGCARLWTPWTELYHFESASRNPKVTDEEHEMLRIRWNERLIFDPYYNHNLAPHRDDWVEKGLR